MPEGRNADAAVRRDSVTFACVNTTVYIVRPNKHKNLVSCKSTVSLITSFSLGAVFTVC
jgi:hypothetical protein